jgi:hypothetical protein
LAQDRNEQRSSPHSPDAPIWVAETLRTAASNATPTPPHKEERSSFLWRVFGGTALSITGLVIVTVCQHFNGSLNELRGDLGRLNDELRKELLRLNADLRKDFNRLSEGNADLVKKEEFNSRLRSVWDSVKALQTDNAAVTAMKERSATLEQQFKAAEEERKEIARELQHWREAKAAEEERKALVRELQELRERLAALEGRQRAPSPVKAAVHREE